MKLKKIVSLALAGILAVSMLAGCGNNSSDDVPNVPDEPTVTSNEIVTALNSKLSPKQTNLLSFSSSDKLASALAWINGDHDSRLIMTNALISAAGEPTALPAASATVNRILREYNGTIPAVNAINGNVDAARNFLGLNTSNAAFLYVYMVDGSVTTASAVADRIMQGVAGNGLQDRFYNVINVVDKNNAAIYDVEYEYEGYAEMVEVSNSNSGDTAYVIAILIQQHATTQE